MEKNDLHGIPWNPSGIRRKNLALAYKSGDSVEWCLKCLTLLVGWGYGVVISCSMWELPISRRVCGIEGYASSPSV